MKRMLISAAALLACIGCAQAGDAQLDKVRKTVSEALPGIQPEMITPSSAPGIYQVQKGQEFGYVTGDGRYFIHGDMIDLSTGEEITEALRGSARKTLVSQFGPDEVIEFAPKNPKWFITVFTDIDCGYCRKLHSEMASYHAQGIGVRYLFYPRSGPNTPSFQQAQAVWCSADRKQALTQAKAGQRMMGSSNCPNPVQRQYDAGEALGVNATPTLVLPDGEVVRGYVRAEALAARLAQTVAKNTHR
jgi:thiol:disulfide interchange protein DsbC